MPQNTAIVKKQGVLERALPKRLHRAIAQATQDVFSGCIIGLTWRAETRVWLCSLGREQPERGPGAVRRPNTTPTFEPDAVHERPVEPNGALCLR